MWFYDLKNTFTVGHIQMDNYHKSSVEVDILGKS